MKNKTLITFILFAVLPLLTAMGGLQGQSPEKIPVPAKKFVATFIDQMDVTTECQDVSIEGETFLEGMRGNGINTLPFESIQEVSFLLKGVDLLGIVKLRDGNTFELTIEKNHKAYGRTKYGTFQIKLLDLKKLTLRKS